jgi:hypothetical protein
MILYFYLFNLNINESKRFIIEKINFKLKKASLNLFINIQAAKKSLQNLIVSVTRLLIVINNIRFT